MQVKRGIEDANRVYNLKEFCIPLKFRIEYVVHVFTRRSKENEKKSQQNKKVGQKKKDKKKWGQ